MKFTTITADDWKRALQRKEPNAVAEQIKKRAAELAAASLEVGPFYQNLQMIALIRKNETGEIRRVATLACVASWEEGNYSCDCNREILFETGKESPKPKCSEGRFSVNLQSPETGEIIYQEYEP